MDCQQAIVVMGDEPELQFAEWTFKLKSMRLEKKNIPDYVVSGDMYAWLYWKKQRREASRAVQPLAPCLEARNPHLGATLGMAV